MIDVFDTTMEKVAVELDASLPPEEMVEMYFLLDTKDRIEVKSQIS